MNAFRLVVIGAITLFPALCFAQADCLGTAPTNDELEQCGLLIVDPLEKKVDSEFARLRKKFSTNADMVRLLGQVKLDWDGYRNVHCIMEGTAAAGGTVKIPSPLVVNRTFISCIIRTLKEMNAAISKL